MKSNSGGKAVRYNKWGYIFLIPFIVVFVIFQLVPLVNTIYNSFFENYMSGLTQVGPRFVGLDNYKALFSSGDIWTYFKNTMVLWIMCFIPQIFLSLLLGAWFSDVRLKLKGSRFFKTVIYLPNLIMASAFSMLFFTLFSDGGPINSLLMQWKCYLEKYLCGSSSIHLGCLKQRSINSHHSGHQKNGRITKPHQAVHHGDQASGTSCV